MSHRLVLRPPGPHDEADAVRAQAEFDGFEFLLGWAPELPWSEYLATLERERTGDDLPADRVPATFLLASLDGELVGRLSIRHRLNEYLAEYGGHLGYGVRPAWRGRGIATAVLRHGLELAAGLVDGERVLVTCDDDNLASAAVIERCGGVLEDRRADPFDGGTKRRYWIELPARSGIDVKGPSAHD